MLNLIPLPYKLGALAAVVAIGLGWFAWHDHTVFNEGVKAESEIVQKQVQEDRDGGIEGARNASDCAIADGVWSVARRSCETP